jgi:hypothetical protein
VTTIKLVTTNNHEPPTHLVFHLLCYCAANATSSYLSTCICDRESRSSELSSSSILHRKRANKFFRSDLRDCSLASSHSLSCLIYLFVGRAKSHRLQCELRQADRRRQRTASLVRFILSNHVLPIGCVDLHRHDFAR